MLKHSQKYSFPFGNSEISNFGFKRVLIVRFSITSSNKRYL